MIDIHHPDTTFPILRRIHHNPGAAGDSQPGLQTGEVDEQGRLLRSGYDRLIGEARRFIDERPNALRTAVIP